MLMAEHGNRMAILSDEGGIFDLMAGRYNSGVPNFDIYLKAHAGAAIRVDRGSRPPLFLRRPALTIGMSPQPHSLRAAAKIQGFGERGGSARILYGLPPSLLGHRSLGVHPVPAEISRAYANNVHKLLALPAREDDHAHISRLSDPARAEWTNLQRSIEEQMAESGTFAHATDWASKLPGAAARLAALFHCAQYSNDRPENELISIATMECALTWAAVLAQHALAVFDLMSADGKLEAARRVWGWVIRERKAQFTARDCFNAVRGTFPTMEDLQPALSVLTERYHLIPIQPSRRGVGRPSVSYRVNRHFEKEWTNGMA